MSSISSTNKPRLSFWQIWNMSFGFLGIQFGFALQNANTSRIFETLGADTDNLAVYWLAAPITGLIVQPIIGFYSDRTWHKTWGRRRPYFTVGAILASFALCMMPNSSLLWMAVGVLWIMDASINISMEPFRAFVGDMLPPSQRTGGFAMQSFFIGLGAVVASALPWMFSNWFGITDHSTGITSAVKYSFYIGAFMLLACVLWTVFTTKEYPPSEESEANLTSRENRKIDNEPKFRKKFFDIGLILLVISIVLGTLIYFFKLEKELYVLAFGFALFGIVHMLSSIYISQGRSYLGIVSIVKDFNTMPKTMVQLASVQFFSWFALFAMWIYTTSATTSHMYDMKLTNQQVGYLYEQTEHVPPAIYDSLKTTKEAMQLEFKKLENFRSEKETQINIKVAGFFLDKKIAPTLEPSVVDRLKYVKSQYDRGGDWVGFLFAIYNGIAALAAICLPFLAKVTSRRITHLIALTCGALGLISFYFITDPDSLWMSMIGVGIAWASILSIPYAMLSGSLPAEKMGYYMGVFNFFIVIPQIVAGTLLGFMLNNLFHYHSIYILVAGGVSMLIAGLLCLRVRDEDEVVIKQKV